MMRRNFLVLAMVPILYAGCAPGSKLDQATKDLAQAAEKAAAKSQEQSIGKDLQEVYSAYMNYHDANRAGPANWDELLKYAAESKANVEAIERVKAKGVQVTWGVKLSSLTEGATNTVFAQGGGPTMMFDGSLR